MRGDCQCGRKLVRSPMNPKVRLCPQCLNQKANCKCEPPKAFDLMEALRAALREP